MNKIGFQGILQYNQQQTMQQKKAGIHGNDYE